jgi:photosystem II stability/assembly factor-like uncharacterized protein
MRAQAANGEEWFRLTRGYPTGRMPPRDVLDRAGQGRQPRGTWRTRLALPGDRWVPIGPSPIAVPGSPPYAGRVTSVAAHPSDAKTLFIGTDGAGVWKTTDRGGSWTWLTPDLPVPAINSVAVDPSDPRLLYATTIDRTYPVRLLRSTDGGATWTVSAITGDRGQALSPMSCSVNVLKACIPPSSGRVIVDPAHAGSATGSTIYYVGLSHVLQSDNSGQTFHAAFALPTDLDFSGPDAPARNFEAEYIRDAVIDPSRPDRLFVATATPHCLDAACTRADAAVTLYRVFGGRASARAIATIAGPPFTNLRYADPGPVYVMRIRLAVSRANPDVMALALRDERQFRVRVFRSSDAGDTWAEVSSIANSLTWPLDVAFAPDNAETIYVSSNSIYRSGDGGQSWTAFANPHADNISIAFSSDRTLLVGGDGGLWTSSGTSPFTPLHTTLPSITEFYSVAAHPRIPLLVAGGSQDNGTAVFQGPIGWSAVVGGDGGDVVFDPSASSPVLFTDDEWSFTAGGLNTFIFFRCAAGRCVERSDGLDLTLAGPFIPRIVMDPSNPATLYLTVGKLFRTDDSAGSWSAASPPASGSERCWQDPAHGRSCANGQYFVAAAVAPTASQTLYAGALNGDVWASTNRGATWQSVAGAGAGPLPVRAVTDIVVDPLDARTVYVSYSGFDSGGSGVGHVFRSRDGGASWENVSAGLPDVPVNTLLVDPESLDGATPRTLYAGTDIGVYRITLDGAGRWEPFGSGLPPVVVNRLAYNVTSRQLLAATYGRGIWAISDRFK